MTSLRAFEPYTSYRLHWFPYEITRCTQLRGSTVSTRALYGNFKFRPPFPRLTPPVPREHGPLRPCSVCDRPFEDLERFRVWISPSRSRKATLRTGTRFTFSARSFLRGSLRGCTRVLFAKNR